MYPYFIIYYLVIIRLAILGGVLLDFLSWISWVLFTEVLAVVFFALAFFLVPFFSNRFFYGHLSPSGILTNVVICGSLILPFLLTFNIFYSFIQSAIETALIDVFGSGLIDVLASGRVLSSIVLLFLYMLWAIVVGALNENQRFYWFLHW